MNIICCIKNTIKESLIEASVLLKLSNGDVQSAAASSVFIFEANRAFVKVFKRITGLAILLCTFLLNMETINAQDTIVKNQQTSYREAQSKTLKFDSIKSKTNSKGEVPYSVSHGQFLAGKLYNGQIDYYNSKDELVISKLVRKGAEQKGYIYKDKKVNLYDSLGRRTGLWVSPREAFHYDKYREIENADNLYQDISHIDKYTEGERVDTSYTFNKEGWLAFIRIHARDSIPPQNIHYFVDGRISKVEFFVYKPDIIFSFTRSETVYYSDTLADCIVKKETYINQNINFIYQYVDCQLYSKTSVQEEWTTAEEIILGYRKMPPPCIPDHDHLNPTNCDGGSIEVEETLLVLPKSKPIPYTVETGSFDASEKHLVNGEISYFDAQGVLIETKKVIDGVISD